MDMEELKPRFDLDRLLRAPFNESKIRESEELISKQDLHRRIDRLKRDAPAHWHCTLGNFDVTSEAQMAVLMRANKIAREMPRFLAERRQLFIWGTCGTGKDHLAVSLLKRAAVAGHSVGWVEGLTFFEEVADAYGRDRSHSEVYARWSAPDVLVISDPVFSENWTPAKQEALRKLVRRREHKLTWITANVKGVSPNPKSDDSPVHLFGVDTFDRLMERAVVLQCRWPSNRLKKTGDW